MIKGKKVAFIGTDKYEILLYLSRILYHLNKKVLLVDFSETKALTESIPIPNLLHESTTYLDYRGIDFIKGRNYSLDMEKNYDYILFDLGFRKEVLEVLSYDEILYVTDLQLHNAKRIGAIKGKRSNSRQIVIKDVLPCKVTPEYILEQIDESMNWKNIYIIDQDDLDTKLKLHSQYNQRFYFHKLSKSMKTFLIDIILEFDENLNKSQIQNAYKRAERGK